MFLRNTVPFSGSSLWVCEKLVPGGLSSKRFRRSSWTENGAGAARGQVLWSISLSSGKLRGVPHPSPDAAEQQRGQVCWGPPAPCEGGAFSPTCSLRNGLPTHLFPQEWPACLRVPWEWSFHLLVPPRMTFAPTFSLGMAS